MSSAEVAKQEPEPDRLEVPGSPYALALWNLIVRPPRRRYDAARLGPSKFRLWSCPVRRTDLRLHNPRGLELQCSHWEQDPPQSAAPPASEPRPCVIYLHQNASCRLEALQFVPLFLPLGISVFAFDFSGCGESEGDYISLGWFERDDLAVCVDYLRRTNRVSAIGLWGRSMGAVTALLHADRDPSIAGMVLDSPFCNLRQLATELAQSEYLAVKVPTWLLAGAIGMGRLRIKSLCGFDIDELAPENHVGESFIPALFVVADGDDFIPPHHTRRLYEMYTGDKEIEIVEGDHNTRRCPQFIRKAVQFLCRTFRCHPSPDADHGLLASQLGIDAIAVDGAMEFPATNRKFLRDACQVLVFSAVRQHRGLKAWVGDRLHAAAPVRAEGALQLNDPEVQAGFYVCLLPLPSEWGGLTRPPVVIFAYVTPAGLFIARGGEGESEQLAHVEHTLELREPLLCRLEVRLTRWAKLCLQVGVDGPLAEVCLNDAYDREVLVWPATKHGEAEFFDTALTDLTREETSALTASATRGAAGEASAGARPVEPASSESAAAAAPSSEAASSSQMCQQQ